MDALAAHLPDGPMLDEGLGDALSACAAALARYPAHAARSCDALLERLRHVGEREAHHPIVRALAAAVIESPDALAKVEALLASPAANVRSRACLVLGAVGPRARGALPALRIARRDEHVARAARRAVELIEGVPARAPPEA